MRVDARPAANTNFLRALAPAFRLALAVLTTLAASVRPEPRALDEIRARGELRIVTMNSPTSYYLGANGAEGLEFELARAFAQKLGVTLVISPVANTPALQAELASKRADIAAAQLTADEAGLRSARRHSRTRRSGSSWSSGERGAAPRHHSARELEARRARRQPAGTGAAETEEHRRAESGMGGHRAERGGPARGCRLRRGELRNHRRARVFVLAPPLSECAVGFTLPATRPAQWIVRKDAKDLLHEVDKFFDEIKSSGQLAQLQAQASGDSHAFDFVESLRFQAHIAERLGAFRHASRTRARKPASTGGFWLRSAIRNRSGIRRPHPAMARSA